MYGRKLPPPPPQRCTWADKTKEVLDSVRKQREEIVQRLDEQERVAKELCNHTFPDGKSAIVHEYDVEGDDTYNRCSVCGQ